MRQPHGPLPPGSDRERFLESQPTYWLKRCYQALRRTVDAELRHYGITLSQRDVLLLLYEEGPQAQGELCRQLGLEQSSVSRLVDGLARRGLVALQPDAQDRRRRVASLTADGEHTLHSTPGSSQLGGRRMVEGLSDGERAELLRLLRHCTNNLSTGPLGDRRSDDGEHN